MVIVNKIGEKYVLTEENITITHDVDKIMIQLLSDDSVKLFRILTYMKIPFKYTHTAELCTYTFEPNKEINDAILKVFKEKIG